MIDRINGNNYTNTYGSNGMKRTSVSATKEDTPAFLLDYDEDGVIWERSEDEKKSLEEKAREEKLKSLNKSKPKEVSQRDTYESTLQTKNDSASTTQDKSILEPENLKEMFRQIFSGVAVIFRSILNFVWYGPDENKSENETKNEAENKAENKTDNSESTDSKLVSSANIAEDRKESNSVTVTGLDRDELIRESISKKDSEGVMRILTDNYRNMPAKNSTLLTQYDRHGNITSISGADEERILKGKKSINM